METNGILPEQNEKARVPSRTPSPSPEEGARDAKAAKILDACKKKDIENLRILATSGGGLVSDNIRRQACSCH